MSLWVLGLAEKCSLSNSWKINKKKKEVSLSLENCENMIVCQKMRNTFTSEDYFVELNIDGSLESKLCSHICDCDESGNIECKDLEPKDIKHQLELFTCPAADFQSDGSGVVSFRSGKSKPAPAIIISALGASLVSAVCNSLKTLLEPSDPANMACSSITSILSTLLTTLQPFITDPSVQNMLQAAEDSMCSNE